jgi:hypothetical protein
LYIRLQLTGPQGYYIYVYTHTHTQGYYIYVYTHTHTHTHTHIHTYYVYVLDTSTVLHNISSAINARIRKIIGRGLLNLKKIESLETIEPNLTRKEI